MNIFGHATYVGDTGYNAHCKNFFRALSKHQNLKIRNYTVGPNWQGLAAENGNCHGKDVTALDKELIILQTLWNNNNNLEDYPIHGYQRGSFNHDINLILAEANHHYFYHSYSGPKIGYTVWETTKYYEPFFERLKECDQIWVPTKWQAQITINQGADPSKVKVVPEGVDSSVFFPENIQLTKNIFRFIVFGRWDARKSTVEIIRAFKNLFGNNSKFELLISVEDKYNFDGLGTTKDRLKHYDLEAFNIRSIEFVSREEYVKYLKSGHVFLSCSRSEGWNLPLIEAMACGTPSIYSDCSGQLEFAAGKGIPVKIKKEIEAKNFYKPNEVCQGNWYEPDFKDLEEKMVEVYNNYEYYKKKALEESEEIRRVFTWDNAAKIASKLLSEIVSTQEEKVKESDPRTYSEIFEFNTYEHFCTVEPGDSVLDLGCSKGFFYFKHKNKNINYYGVDASPECIRDFYGLLTDKDNPIVINAMVDNEKAVRMMKPFFHDTEEKMVATLSFSNLMKLMPEKINFLKFDIEGGEKEFLGDNKSYELFKSKVEKFSGEIHMLGGSISRQQAYDFIKKIQNDPDIYCKIHSCDGADIDFYFWSNPDRYHQIILSGIVKKNSRHPYFEFRQNRLLDNGAYHIVNESPSLGDIIAWIPMVDRFQKEKKQRVNLYTPYGELFQSRYPNIHFDYYNAQPQNGENVIRIGTYDIDGKKWSEYNLQELAAKILGIKYVPTVPKIATPNHPVRNFKNKYVCIATQSTAQFKYWNNPTGWQETVDYVKSLGYDVVCIDKYPSFGVDGAMNSIPNNCINKTGEFPLMDRINDLMHCEFFIGLTSGLSWLAWGLNKPVVFISGISLPRTDFYTPYRVTNTSKNLCHGCASEPEFVFDKYDWNFCPKKKNFECTKQISFSMVKEKIDQLVEKLNLGLDPNKSEEDFSLINAEASFLNGPKILIKDTKYKNYLVHLFYFYKGEWIGAHEDANVESGYSYESFISNRNKWRFKVYAHENNNIKLVYQKTYNEKGEKILIEFGTDSSDLEKVYLKKAIEFEKENECEVWIKSKYSDKLKLDFPNFNRFVSMKESFSGYYAYFNITRHEIETNRHDHQYSKKLWLNRGKPNITINHSENWIEYPQEELFEDIMNYE